MTKINLRHWWRIRGTSTIMFVAAAILYGLGFYFHDHFASGFFGTMTLFGAVVMRFVVERMSVS